MHGSAKDTRVKIASWTGDFNEHICQTTEAIGDTRSASVEPVVIGLKVDFVKGSGPPEITKTYNADGVDVMEPAALSLGMLISDEFIKADTSTLFHAFEDETEIHREFNPQSFVSLKDVEPSQDGTLVVRRTTSNELAVTGNGQSERIGIPSVALQSLDSKGSAPLARNYLNNRDTHGLDVKVTIKEYGLLLWIVADFSQNCRRKLDFVTVEDFSAEIF